jgi:hypothetical protein
MDSSLIEVEVDTPTNSNWFFPPMRRSLRGAFDFNRVPEPSGRRAAEFPRAIPGERLTLNVSTGTATLHEPLYDPQHRETRAKIERRGMALQDENHVIEGVHLPTWLFWIANAVKQGTVKIVRGKLPEKIDGTPDLTILSRQAPTKTDALLAQMADQNERLTVAFEKMAASMERLAKK